MVANGGFVEIRGDCPKGRKWLTSAVWPTGGFDPSETLFALQSGREKGLKRTSANKAPEWR
jgi:hypothetical protein